MTDQHCLNCGEPLRGAYCHACGQPVKGMVRHFGSVIGDALDTVFEYDSRIWRTLLPLYFNPGRITLDYLAGRRIRFVTPFRLVFVMLVLAFLMLQLTVSPGELLDEAGPSGIYGATTVAGVEAARDRAIAELEQAVADAEGADRTRLARGLDNARSVVEREAQRRIDWLVAVEAARRDGREPPPEPPSQPMLFIDENLEPWDPELNPLEIGWLPAVANRQINAWIGAGVANLNEAQRDPERFVDAFLGLLPAALFALMPIFALLLKLLYVSSGRLYMSHMVVALNSHAFLGLALMVSTALEWMTLHMPAGLGLQTAFGFLDDLAHAWTPVYLLIMQRRVYAQSWPLTLLKFALLGSIYSVLLLIAIVVALLVTLVRG